MATRKTASKVSKKATASVDFSLDKKPSKNTTKRIRKEIKKTPILVLVFAILFIAVGGVTGFFVTKILTKNDCFELVGQEEITLVVGESYVDEGVKVISFGKDLSNKAKTETNMTKKSDGTFTSNEEGTFYIAYTVDSLKYGTIFKIQKIKLISFVLEGESGE